MDAPDSPLREWTTFLVGFALRLVAAVLVWWFLFDDEHTRWSARLSLIMIAVAAVAYALAFAPRRVRRTGTNDRTVDVDQIRR